MINGVVNRDFHTAAGTVIDGNLYWKPNTVEGGHLVSTYATVPAFHAATGLEAHGIGGAASVGTDPKFEGLRFDVVDRTQAVWELRPSSETPPMTAFLLASGSPAIGSGIVVPELPLLGALPDSRDSRDLGAIPFGTPAAEYEGFPFDPKAASDLLPPARPALRIRP